LGPRRQPDHPTTWILIPIFNHAATIEEVVRQVLEVVDLPCLIIDDGSGPETRSVLDSLQRRRERVSVHRLESNRGKGAALRRGFRIAHDAGATHVIHLDADGQHECADIPRFLAAIAAEPSALVLGKPVFDETVPGLRLYGRQLSRWIVWLCTLSFAVDDPLCGFRAVPLESTLRLLENESLGDRMEFEPGLTVVFQWTGYPVRNLATRVHYLEGGLSNFDGVRDTWRMAKLYGRLLARSLTRLPGCVVGRRTL